MVSITPPGVIECPWSQIIEMLAAVQTLWADFKRLARRDQWWHVAVHALTEL